MPTVSVVSYDEQGNLIAGEVKEIEVNEGEILFDELERQGEHLPHGCLAGSCGSCRIQVLEGEDNLAPVGAIEQDTLSHLKQTYCQKYGEEFLKNKTIRLSCRAKVNGNVKIAPIK